MTIIIQNVISDHINNWSDIDEKQINRISSQKAKDSYKQTPASRCHTSWFYNQTLQTLWKTRMQVCWRPWAWSQVLPFGQPTWKHSAHGLYSPEIPGTSRRICREFSYNRKRLLDFIMLRWQTMLIFFLAGQDVLLTS